MLPIVGARVGAEERSRSLDELTTEDEEETPTGARDDTLQLDTHERMGALATTKASAERLKADGKDHTEPGSHHHVALAEAQTVIAEWPTAPKKAAEKLLDHYGPPNEATPTKPAPARWAPIATTRRSTS